MIRIFFNPLDAKSVEEYPIAEGTQLIHFLQANYPSGFDGALRVFVGIEELDLIDLDYEVKDTDQITMLVMPSADPVFWAAVGKIVIQAAIAAAIGYAINLIFAPKTPSFGDEADESPVYSLSPTRNSARLGQPIASHYGTVSHPPAYASAPYAFYYEGSNDQYVDELLCLGQGEYEIQEIYIGETPIEAIEPGSVKYWVFDKDDHHSQTGRISDKITKDVANTEMPFPFWENVFTSPEVEDFSFAESKTENNSTPIAISGDAYAASVDPETGMYLLGRIEGVDDSLVITGGDTITLAGTTSNNITFVVGSVAPDPTVAGKMTIFQQWNYSGSQLVDEQPLSGTYTTDAELVDGMTGGPFRVQKLGTTINRIDCDIVFPQGLFRVDGTSGKIKSLTVEMEFTYQQIDEDTGDDIGLPVTQNKTWTSTSRVALRATVSSGDLPAGSYECTVRRVTPIDDDSRKTDLVTWVGLKGYVSLTRNKFAYGKVSLIAFRLKATNAIAAAARSRIRVVAKRILATGESDNPITVIKDIWTNTDYGLGFPASQLDPAMDDLETFWGDPQGPKFNGSFDQKATGFDAMQSAASLAAANVVNNGQLTNVVADRKQQVRHAMFSSANIVRDSLEIIYTFDALGDYTGNVVEYRDPLSFTAEYVYAPEETANPESYTLFGSTDGAYAQKMANYLWNAKAYRRKAIVFTSELEGLIPSFGQRIGVSHPMPDWGQSGVFVEQIDALTWRVDQPLDWTEDNVILIRDDQGLPSSPYTVTQGVNPQIVVFSSEVPVISDQQGRDPTNYAFGTANTVITDWLVTKILPKGDNLVQIEGQIYNEDVYRGAPWQMNPVQDICKEYECDVFDSTVLALNPLNYLNFYDLLNQGTGGLVTQDLTPNDRDGVMGGGAGCVLNTDGIVGCTDESWHQGFNGVDSLLGMNEPVSDLDWFNTLDNVFYVGVMKLANVTTTGFGGTVAGFQIEGTGTGTITDLRMFQIIEDGRQKISFQSYGVSPVNGQNNYQGTGYIDVHDLGVWNESNEGQWFVLGLGYEKPADQTYDVLTAYINGVKVADEQFTFGIVRAIGYTPPGTDSSIVWGLSRKAQSSQGFDLARQAIFQGDIGLEAMESIYQAFLQNFTTYQDPDCP